MHNENKRLPTVAIVGDARLPPDDVRLKLAFDCGRILVDAGYRILTGGLGGIMAAASEGGQASKKHTSGAIIALLPGRDPGKANEFADIAIPTGLDIARNVVVANADALIAIGGGAGALSEIAMAWQLQRLIVALRTEGWSGKLADQRIDTRSRYPDIDEDRVFGADTAAEAVQLIQTWLPRYQRKGTSISA